MSPAPMVQTRTLLPWPIEKFCQLMMPWLEDWLTVTLFDELVIEPCPATYWPFVGNAPPARTGPAAISVAAHNIQGSTAALLR